MHKFRKMSYISHLVFLDHLYWGVKNCVWMVSSNKIGSRSFYAVWCLCFLFFLFLAASFCGEAEVVDIVEVTWRSLTGLALWFQWWPIVIFWAGSFITFILLPLLFLPFLSFVL